MNGGFVKLYGSILTSSVWQEPMATRLVWITMLTLADKKGYVNASIPGLANLARVDISDCMKALDTLMMPDPFSRSKNDDGRRIEEVDGGWRLINHEKYRELRTDKQIQDAQRQARHRMRDRCDESRESRIEAEADAEAYADNRQEPTTPTARETSFSEVRMKLVLDTLGVPPELRTPWSRLIAGMTEGMGAPGMKPINPDVLAEAAQELAAAGGDVTPSRYKAFVGKVLNRNYSESSLGGAPLGKRAGRTLAASELIVKLKRARKQVQEGPQAGNYALPVNWREGFSETEVRVIDALGPERLMTGDEKQKGIVLAQLARAMEEAGL